MKIAIIGAAGGIGSSVAYTLAREGVGDELLLVDRNEDALKTHVWDLEQLRVSVRPFEVRAVALEQVVEADVVVVSASVPPRKDSPRIEFLAENVSIYRDVARALAARPDWPGVVVVATNPVDPLLTELQRATGIDRRRIVGYNVNDTLRLRYGISEALGVEPHRVDAWVLGEHGDRCVPLLDRVKVDDAPVTLDEAQRKAVVDYQIGWYPRWVALGVLRTSTWTSGNGITAMVRAIVEGRDEVWPASLVLDGEYGIDGVALGVPVLLGPGGVREVLDWQLSEAELAGMREGAAYVAEALAAVTAQPS